ncbi:proton-coupled amino acid transporter-like protein pathetic [Epargyreus clarus]|uniref:proton-coupled amino acid transporter-like protein pathetic n=1 Tax=Epargyreus clarus TaxID=520877 RepID=UPI003C2E1092
MEDTCKEKNEDLSTAANSTITLHQKSLDDLKTYNPFEHRNVPHPTSTIGSFVHLLKSSLGSGLLAMPVAFKHTGLIPGCLGTALVGLIATHCVHILVSTSRDISRECREPALNYTDTCARVFKHGPQSLRRYEGFVRHFADYAMAGVCLGGTSVYVIFIASSLKDIVDQFTSSHLPIEAYSGILLIPLILLIQVRYLKFLVPFSVLANMCLIVTVAITCYYTFADVQFSDGKLFGNVLEWPLFISTAIFAMEGINVVMPVENEMAHPEHFLGCPGVLNTSMVLVVILYGIVGFFGYLKYGDYVQGSITLSLPEGEPLALTAKILVVIAVFFTYGLQMYAPMDILWIRVKGRISQKYHNLGQIVLRTASVMLTVILTIAIPDLELMIGLVGSVFFSTLGLFIPLVVQTVHKWDRGLGRCSYILWKNGLLLLFYLVVLLSGCYSSIKEIVKKYS